MAELCIFQFFIHSLQRHTLLRKVLGMHSETCPETVIEMNNKLMVQFLRKHLGQPADQDLDQDVQRRSELILPLFP